MARRARRQQPKSAKTLAQEIEAIFDADLEDAELRDKLEDLSSDARFNEFTYLWGPELHRRNRVMFRPFILDHFQRSGTWKKHADRLDPWFEEVDRLDDVELFRRLYPWKHGATWWGSVPHKRWIADVKERFLAATETHERNQQLAKLEFPHLLDEATATLLYETDPVAAKPFVLRHPPHGRAHRWDATRKLPEKLCKLILDNGDDDLYFELYRVLVPKKRWQADATRLAESIEDADELDRELERHHPRNAWDFDIPKIGLELLQHRGRDVVPYVLRHIDDFAVAQYWGNSSKSAAKVREMAKKHDWWDLWSVMVRKGTETDFNREVVALVDDKKQPEEVVFRRLAGLTGVSNEWTWSQWSHQQIHQLSDKTAVALYKRFPTLIHGPFRQHLELRYGSTYSGLAKAAVTAKDDQLLDHLASKILCATWTAYARNSKNTRFSALVKHYEKVRKDPTAFARRVASVLGRLGEFDLPTWSFRRLVENNPLTKLFFTDTAEALLTSPEAIRDLLEGANFFVQRLAIEALARDDDRARDIAGANLDLLQATLMRRLQRRTRLLAFRALRNAATTEGKARYILDRARQALDLPAHRYPKGHLVELVGELCHRWPSLRSDAEQPTVYVSQKHRG